MAVDEKLDYSLVKTGSNQYWVAQAAAVRIFSGQKYQIVKTVSGKKLIGLKYTAPFDSLPAVKKVASHPKFHTVIPTDQNILPISTDEGTGLVHTAVSAGTEDFKLGQKIDLPMVHVIKDNADYLSDLGFLSGKNAKADPRLVLDYLEEHDWAFKIEPYSHRYPACWRCKTELVWKVTDEWYISMDKGNPSLRQKMIKVAKKIRWIPKFGLDRELDWLNNMHDWLISKKNRYWGLALPIWECSHCGHFQVIGSKAELKRQAVAGWDKFAGKSLHKPQIDQVKINCSHCGRLTSRIEPVGNPWLDAGIIPFSTLIDPHTRKLSYTGDKKYWRQWFPADLITESFPGQFKNWFYSLIAMATVLEDTHPFQAVLGFATLLGEDGRPMHKSWGNAIEFNQGAETIGVDVMRWLYCRQNPAQNLLFGYQTATEIKRQFHLLLWNSYRFFVNYAAIDNWQPTVKKPSRLTPLDQWLLSRLSHTQDQVEASLDSYDCFHATQALESFVSDLSTWYIRRSRDRVGPNAADVNDKPVCYSTLYRVFQGLSVILSPFMPYLSDRIYTNLTGHDSVHLSNWPQLVKADQNPTLEKQFESLRQIVELGHAQRKLHQINLRQPLGKISISGSQHQLPSNLNYLLLDELNAKTIAWASKSGPLKVKLDTKLTPQLKAEGQAREIIRQIQAARKAAATRLDQKVIVELPDWPQSFTQEITQKTLATKLVKASKLRILKQ